MKSSIIAAMGKNRVIGKDNKLMWRLPDELAYFKQTTMGHHLIMGRKTFESYPKVLPGRTSIILTGKKSFNVPETCFVKPSLQEAFAFAKGRDEKHCFVIGGAQVYAQIIREIETIYLTYIDFEEDGDAYFPEFDENDFHVSIVKEQVKNKRNPYPWTAKRFDRK